MALVADCKTLLASWAVAEKHRPSKRPKNSTKVKDSFLPTASPPKSCSLAEHYIAGKPIENSESTGAPPPYPFCASAHSAGDSLVVLVMRIRSSCRLRKTPAAEGDRREWRRTT